METLTAVIIGTSHVARMAAEILTDLDYVVYGFLTMPGDDTKLPYQEVPVIGKLQHKTHQALFRDPLLDFFIAPTNRKYLRKLFLWFSNQYQKPPINVIHPHTSISDYAKLTIGNIIGAYTTIAHEVSLGYLNAIHPHVTIENNVTIGHANQISAGSFLGSNCTVGNHVFIGPGTIINPGISIGSKSIIGAGSVVLQNVPTATIVHGNPAKIVS